MSTFSIRPTLAVTFALPAFTCVWSARVLVCRQSDIKVSLHQISDNELAWMSAYVLVHTHTQHTCALVRASEPNTFTKPTWDYQHFVYESEELTDVWTVIVAYGGVFPLLVPVTYNNYH